jgi:hypothetical protein
MKFRELSEEKRFRSAVTVLLAGLTILGSLIVILNNRSYVRGIEAGRDSRILGIRYLARFGRSLWESAAEKNLMVSWQELGGLMMQAEAYEKMSGGTDASLYRISRPPILTPGPGPLTSPGTTSIKSSSPRPSSSNGRNSASARADSGAPSPTPTPRAWR